MPRQKKKPSYLLHKPSGQAYARYSGKCELGTSSGCVPERVDRVHRCSAAGRVETEDDADTN
jgi:hypothetical protein